MAMMVFYSETRTVIANWEKL